MQNWAELYKELCTLIAAEIEAVEWQDIWHNQVNFLEDEHPFPTPAIFYSFRIIGTKDAAEKVQHVNLQVDIYVYYETFADTYKGSWNQSDALSFLDLITNVYALLHGSSGTNYSEMRRIGFAPVDTGSAGNLYVQTFECNLVDYAAKKVWNEGTVDDIEIEKGSKPPAAPEENNDFILS